MNKIISTFVIGILILSGVGVLAINNDSSYNEKMKNESIVLSKPTIEDKEKYISLNMNEASSYLQETGKPMLPIVTKVYALPYGSEISKIDVFTSETKELKLQKKVIPCPEPIPMIEGIQINNDITLDEDTYDSIEIYPSNIYSYTTGSGRQGLERVIYLVIQCHPIRYSPKEDMLYYSSNIDIEIVYKEPSKPIIFPDEYDMVIIAPDQFSSLLEPLVTHKNNLGINTMLKTTENIFNEYNGVDKPEQIKYFIKEAYDELGIDYVLLVGGLNSLIHATRKDDQNQGSEDWYVPVRYTNLKMGGSVDDPGYISDLYYADLYDSELNFSSWDSNNDGIFAKWAGFSGKDTIDLYPDVYVGRLACRNNGEVETMVNKIITYESSNIDPAWFNKMVVIGGDTFDSRDGIYEGEAENQKAIDYMEGFEPIKLWVSNRDTGGLVPEPDVITSTISEGCGILFFAGHGSPELWYSYYPEHDGKTKQYFWFDTDKLTNGDKIPVCVVGSCHGSQFNTTALSFINLYLHKIAEALGLKFLDRWPGNCGFPTPECFCWRLTRVSNGGPISVIGNTGIGYGSTGNNRNDPDGDGINDPDCIEVLGGYIETQFFKAYGQDNINILGNAWGQAISSYLNVYPGMKGQLDCKTVEQWVLFGDPSLKMGGYQ